jgi:hypothetical protein
MVCGRMFCFFSWPLRIAITGQHSCGVRKEKKADSRFQVPFIYAVPAVELNFGYNINASYSTTNNLVWRPRFDS